MAEDLDLPEDVDMNLGLDAAAAETVALPEDGGEDFNLDDFLAENAVDSSEEDNLNLDQEELDLANMFGESSSEESVAGSEPEPEPEPESQPEPELQPEPESESEPELQPEPKPEPESEPSSGWLAEDEAVLPEEPAAADESPAEESLIDQNAKGWAFEGVEDVPVNEADVVDESVTAAGETELLPAVEPPLQEEYNLPESSGFVRWYAGSRDEETFELDRNSESTVLQGDDNVQVIHINVGYDTYGWQVQFADGTYMNLRDVREYQLRNGHLPNPNGTIIYGDMRTVFSNIEKITIYESVRYFTYAPN